MNEKIYLGPAPACEDCAQLGEHSREQMLRECSRWKQALKAIHASGPFSEVEIKLYLKGEAHDFGTYYEVVGSASTEKELDALFWLESNAPEFWADCP